jgi:putative SOS response-associated peptidase YedK
LVPATGWYEWQKIDAKRKRPYHFKPKAEPFTLAGVYDVWKGDGGKAITSFAIVTTDAVPSTRQYHDRMPVVLEDSQFDDWMRGTTDQAAGMMKPYAGQLDIWEVGAEVGNVRNNRPELMERVGLL